MRLPIATKIILVLVTVLSLVCELFHIRSVVEGGAPAAEDENGNQLLPNADAYFLILILRKTPWWAFWTLLTTGLIETQFVPFFVFVVVAATAGRYCEQAWGSHAYLQFVLIMLIGTTFFETMWWGFFTSTLTPICGANGLLAGIVVAIKQLAPGHTIILLRNKLRVQIKWLPLIFLVVVSALWALGFEDNVLAYYLGFVGGWFALRFHHIADGVVERDASDAFSFAHFFPSPVSNWLEVPLDNIYALCSSKLHLVRSFSSDEIDVANQRYAARLSGTILPMFNNGVRMTNERRMMMLNAMEKE